MDLEVRLIHVAGDSFDGRAEFRHARKGIHFFVERHYLFFSNLITSQVQGRFLPILPHNDQMLEALVQPFVSGDPQSEVAVVDEAVVYLPGGDEAAIAVPDSFGGDGYGLVPFPEFPDEVKGHYCRQCEEYEPGVQIAKECPFLNCDHGNGHRGCNQHCGQDAKCNDIPSAVSDGHFHKQ